jgi:hypothetical protein
LAFAALARFCSNPLKRLSISKELAMFNALKYTHQLEAVGIPREQAEAQVQLVLDAIETEVATKSDISGLRADIGEFKSDMKADIVKFKSEMKADIAEFKSEMKTEFAELKTHFVLKLGATVVGSITIATAVIGFLIKS